MDYELLEHTADIKLKIYGNDFADLLENSGHALSDLILPGKNKSEIAREFSIEGDSDEQLLVKFLNELIYLLQSENLIFCKFDIDDNPMYDVKAATYHDLRIEKTRNGLTAQVILDI